MNYANQPEKATQHLQGCRQPTESLQSRPRVAEFLTDAFRPIRWRASPAGDSGRNRVALRQPRTRGLVTVNEEPAQQPNIRVRQLAVDDWREARAARLMALADAPYAFSSTLADEQAYADDLWRRRAGSGRTFGAYDGARIIGVATGIPVDELDVPGTSDSGSPGSGSPGAGSPDAASSESAAASDGHDGAQPEWHLVGMWVAPEHRGQGIADSLVAAVCERARAAGAATVTLWVTEMNGRAIALYRRHGFAPNGLRQLVRPEEPDHWEMQLTCPLR